MNARPRKLLVMFVVLGLGVLAFLGWKTLFPSEPVYQGKPLSAWAQQYHTNRFSRVSGTAVEVEAQSAIRQIGSHGLPFLLDLIRASDSTLKQKLRRKFPPRWHDRLHLKDQTHEIRRTGAHGIGALGTNAAGAIPALIEIATHHPDEDGRYIAVYALSTIGSSAEAAVPFYLQCLTNQDATIREAAATGLGRIQHRPEIVIPALVGYLQSASNSNHHWERSSTIRGLALFGTNARSATPVFLSYLNDPISSVREAVTNWLPEIDPEAAARAGVKRRE